MSTYFTFEWWVSAEFEVILSTNNGKRPSNSDGPVYVTGTFDNWSKSTRLNKNPHGTGYSVTIEVPNQKILFKFVVDGDWLTTNSLKIERDTSGFENNVVYPEDLKVIKEECPSLGFNFISPILTSQNAQCSNNYSWKSDTESSAFTNVSMGDLSPLNQVTDDNSNSNTQLMNELDLDTGRFIDDYDEGDESLEELVASTQGTISGLETRTNSLTRVSDANDSTLINIQEGDRQIRYYTSMSLLSRFTKYFQ